MSTLIVRTSAGVRFETLPSTVAESKAAGYRKLGISARVFEGTMSAWDRASAVRA